VFDPSNCSSTVEVPDRIALFLARLRAWSGQQRGRGVARHGSNEALPSPHTGGSVNTALAVTAHPVDDRSHGVGPGPLRRHPGHLNHRTSVHVVHQRRRLRAFSRIGMAETFGHPGIDLALSSVTSRAPESLAAPFSASIGPCDRRAAGI